MDLFINIEANAGFKVCFDHHQSVSYTMLWFVEGACVFVRSLPPTSLEWGKYSHCMLGVLHSRVQVECVISATQ